MTSGSQGRSEHATMVTVVGVANIPEEIRSFAALDDANYADLFPSRPTWLRTGRPSSGHAPCSRTRRRVARLPCLWRLLGLRLGPMPSTDHVQGWKIADGGDGWIRIETASWCMTVHAVVTVEEPRVSLSPVLTVRPTRGRAHLACGVGLASSGGPRHAPPGTVDPKERGSETRTCPNKRPSEGPEGRPEYREILSCCSTSPCLDG